MPARGVTVTEHRGEDGAPTPQPAAVRSGAAALPEIPRRRIPREPLQQQLPRGALEPPHWPPFSGGHPAEAFNPRVVPDFPPQCPVPPPHEGTSAPLSLPENAVFLDHPRGCDDRVCPSLYWGWYNWGGVASRGLLLDITGSADIPRNRSHPLDPSQSTWHSPLPPRTTWARLLK